MREYGKVFSRIWESIDFRALSEDGRTLALYLLTCTHGTIAGVFRVPDGYACEDLQWDAERVAKGFQNLAEKGFATRCEVTKWVWVRKFLEWNPPENPNQRKAVLKCASLVPENCLWIKEFLPFIASKLPDESNPSATLSQPFLNQEQEQEQEQKNKATRAAPSLTVDDLKVEGVSEEAASAFLATRKRKRAPLTQIAWAGFKREAGKAGWGLDAAVRKAVERGWQSFEADWVKTEHKPASDIWAGAR